MSELQEKIDAELSDMKFDASKINKDNNAARLFYMLPKPAIALILVLALFLFPMGVIAGINKAQNEHQTAAQKLLNEKGKTLNNVLTDDEAEKIAKETIERTYSVDLSNFSVLRDKNTFEVGHEDKDSLETVIMYTFEKDDITYVAAVNITTGGELDVIWNGDDRVSIDDMTQDASYSKKDAAKLKAQACKLASNFSQIKTFDDEKIYVIRTKDGKIYQGDIIFLYYSENALIEVRYNANISKFYKIKKTTSKREINSWLYLEKEWAKDKGGTVEEW